MASNNHKLLQENRNKGISPCHPLTLSFRDNELENEYSRSTLKYTKQQGYMAITVGVFVYLLFGILDQWIVDPENATQVWKIRFTALCVPAIVLALIFSPWFSRLGNLLLASVGLAAGVGLMAIQMLLSVENSAYFYPAMVLVTFFTYNFIGTRFIFALCVDLVLLVSYNLLFGIAMEYPSSIIVTHDFFIISANLIGGAAGYLNERQKRFLFLREKQLDVERHHHMIRSLHDGLTGLPNRDLLYDRISHAMASSKRTDMKHCGLFLDLDGFKSINDALGHEIGDDVLELVAQRLESVVRSIDTVARIGGDEFFVLALDIGNETNASNLAEKILDQFDTPIPGIPESMKLSTSIGICIFPYEGMTVPDIIRRADMAMYRIKSSGKNNYAVAKAPLKPIPLTSQ
ncbi:MAG: GGDEF domain-containing protein [Sedimenticola sp.]